MKKHLHFILISALLFIHYSCNHTKEQFSSEFIENLDLITVLYKDFDHFHSYNTHLDPHIQLTEIDRTERIIKDIEIKKPGLYAFLTVDREFFFVYFEEPIKQEYFRIPEQDENIQWLEHYLNVFYHFYHWDGLPPVEELDAFDIPEDYEERVENIVSLTKADKNMLLSTLQDYSLMKYWMWSVMDIEKPEHIVIKEIITSDEYQYNYYSNFKMTTFSYLEYVPDYFNKDIYEFMVAKSVISESAGIDQEQMKKFQIDLDSMANKLPKLYEKYPQLFHYSFNVMDALKKYPVINEEGDTAFLIDYIDTEYTILYAWGTWCPPCLQFDKDGLPILRELAESKGVSIITLAAEVRNEFDIWKEHLGGAKAGLNNFFGYSKSDNGNIGSTIHSLFQGLNIYIFPSLTIIDQKGNVIFHQDARGPSTTDFLESL